MQDSKEVEVVQFPKSKKNKKMLLEMIGFKFDQYNKMYLNGSGGPVRCIMCKKWITLKTIGMLPPGGMSAVCDNYGCIIMYECEFEVDSQDDSPIPTGINGHGPGDATSA